MKKLLFAATLVALLPLLFSCGKENNGGENKFEEPRFVQYAGKLVPRGGDPAPTSLISQRAETSPIKYLEFTESGLFVLGRQLLGGLSFSTGTYTTTDGQTFTLSNGSTVTVSGPSGAVDVSLRPELAPQTAFREAADEGELDDPGQDRVAGEMPAIAGEGAGNGKRAGVFIVFHGLVVDGVDFIPDCHGRCPQEKGSGAG